MGRNKALPKGNGNGKKKAEERLTTKKQKGCPCPGLKGCMIGEPVQPGEDSMTLICSATTCPYADIPIHKTCFEKYEDQLLTTLREKGSARGWTEYKARRNLWRPSGQGLIVMNCRCICSKGNVHPPEEVVLAERLLVTPSDGDKKKNKKNLPGLNMNGGNNAKQARMQARMEREEMKEEERNVGREFPSSPFAPRRTRNNSVTSFSSQSIVSTSSNNRTAVSSFYASEEEPLGRRGRANHGRRGEKKREESRSRLDSGVSVKTPQMSPVRESNIPLIPANTPPPLTRSYADTIIQPKASQSSEDVLKKSEVDSSSCSLSSSSIQLKIEELSLMPETWYTQSSIGWDMVSRDSYDPEILKSHEKPLTYVLPPHCYDHLKFRGWNPWEGTNFVMGPFSIAGVAIPPKKKKKEYPFSFQSIH